MPDVQQIEASIGEHELLSSRSPLLGLRQQAGTRKDFGSGHLAPGIWPKLNTKC
jgi:hypothetical protein